VAQRPALHLPIAAAVSTALYAGSLVLVAGQQAAHDAELTRIQTPMVDAVARTEAERLAAEAAVRQASSLLDRASGGYEDVAALSLDLDAALAILAGRVQDATGAAARLPSSVHLPSAPGSVTSVAPATAATTTASGK
jgi:hypothetical protein